MQLTWLTGAPISAGLGSPVGRRATRPRLIRPAGDVARLAVEFAKGKEYEEIEILER